MLRIVESKNAGSLLRRRAARMAEAEAIVRPILEAVRKRGDRALVAYARRLDGLDRPTVRVPARRAQAGGQPLSARVALRGRTGLREHPRFRRHAVAREQTAELAPGLRVGQSCAR